MALKSPVEIIADLLRKHEGKSKEFQARLIMDALDSAGYIRSSEQISLIENYPNIDAADGDWIK